MLSLFSRTAIVTWFDWYALGCCIFMDGNKDYIYIYIFIRRVKARATPCPHQPPTRRDNTVSVTQGGTAIPGATKQLLPPDRVLRELYIYIYIYIYARSIKSRDYFGR